MPDDHQRLEAQFGDAMTDIYRTAKRDLGYNATYFLRMLSTDGPLATARQLISSTTPSEGFTQLWMRQRLDLTVEAHVVQERFAPLFSDDERELAQRRLDEYGYRPPRAS
jgi:hypothetical protein